MLRAEAQNSEMFEKALGLPYRGCSNDVHMKHAVVPVLLS